MEKKDKKSIGSVRETAEFVLNYPDVWYNCGCLGDYFQL